MLVRVVGLEPTLLAEPNFESGASTNSTTPAWRLPIGTGTAATSRGLARHASAIRLALPPAAVVLIEVETSSTSQSSR